MIFWSDLMFTKYMPLSKAALLNERRFFPLSATSLYSSLTNFPLISTILISISGLFGDLFISKIKRNFKVKDSGKILPGHGGFLDRYDSISFGLIALFFIQYFF